MPANTQILLWEPHFSSRAYGKSAKVVHYEKKL